MEMLQNSFTEGCRISEPGALEYIEFCKCKFFQTLVLEEVGRFISSKEPQIQLIAKSHSLSEEKLELKNMKHTI